MIVLVIFGPKRLPDLGRSLGRGMREFKDSVTGKDKEASSSRPRSRRPSREAEADGEDDPPATGNLEGGRVSVPRIRPIGHEDRLSIVEHLDELRTRLIICAVAFVVAWALTGWQNHLVLEIVNQPLPDGIQPITLGPAEAFYTTLTNSAYAALLISLPVILYQLYAFVLPAFSPTERRVAFPLLLLVPCSSSRAWCSATSSC